MNEIKIGDRVMYNYEKKRPFIIYNKNYAVFEGTVIDLLPTILGDAANVVVHWDYGKGKEISFRRTHSIHNLTIIPRVKLNMEELI